MFLIISYSEDPHALLVQEELARRGAVCRVLDPRNLGCGATLSARLGTEDSLLWQVAPDEGIRLDDAECIWVRRTTISDEMVGGVAREHALFVRREWQEQLFGSLSGLSVPLVDDPIRQVLCPKPLQLKRATEVGLRVPETLVTNDEHELRAFAGGAGVELIHKTLGANDILLFTRVLSDEDMSKLDTLAPAPVIFQHRVMGAREVRAVVLADRVLAAAFAPEPSMVDGRRDLDVPYEPLSLPTDVEEKLCTLVSRLGLSMAVLDIRLDPDDQPVFLELNPQGQFLYLEILTGMPLVEAVADHLQRYARR
ncbi:MAG: hypothetical protein H6712_02470 [Myxococcales bacterium]|nr:hypothetical protein [Myxococcales bacterium]MCB9712693.1 hypothetical protein [Myxococcales bacterium]